MSKLISKKIDGESISPILPEEIKNNDKVKVAYMGE